jgi:A/G-specific adenine glycosylase
MMVPMQPAEFRKTIWKHYAARGRHTLPWRRTKNPYHILVSEIMLQQTQVDRVIPKYRSFLKRFPSFKALARAPLRDVLLEWKGLGYNRRGLNLKRLAEIVIRDYKGKLPNNRGELVKLPGIGPYTAGAVMTFAWNSPETFIETNIRSVYIHHFEKKLLPSAPARRSLGEGGSRLRKSAVEGIRDTHILELIESDMRNVLRQKKDPRHWYYALMDYGSYLKKTVGNVSKKSSTYTKQTTFKGSTRELRAQVLHEIATHEGITTSQLAKTLGKKPALLLPIVNALTHDGFILKKRSTLSNK